MCPQRVRSVWRNPACLSPERVRGLFGFGAEQNSADRDEDDRPQEVYEQVDELRFADRGSPDHGRENAQSVVATFAQPGVAVGDDPREMTTQDEETGSEEDRSRQGFQRCRIEGL